MRRPKRLAEQIKDARGLMAGLVLAYQVRHALDDAALCAHLGIDEDGLSRLLLARRPRSDHIVQDLLQLAEHVGCQPALLWTIVDPPDDSDAERGASWSVLRQ